ncbi:OmpA family protein [Roseivirga sp. BDSF3-8]|uniref:OmpA family protein n=1 Tax=Roseivirga sp. BDSF3-8 TaxID=3241598 RepID=UPI0035322E0C
MNSRFNLICGFCLLFLLTTIGLQAHAQSPDKKPVRIIKILGQVTDSENQQPLLAKVSYEKIPYGSIVGISNTKQMQGDYAFFVPGNGAYKVVVSAPGYKDEMAEIAFTDSTHSDSVYVRHFELIPQGVGRVIRLEKLIFKVGDYQITEPSYQELDELAKTLLENPQMEIQLEGHTDYRGGHKANLKLSQKRVDAVRDYLVSKGVSKNRIKTKAFGGSQPLTRENTEEARRLNRRVEVRIIKN